MQNEPYSPEMLSGWPPASGKASENRQDVTVLWITLNENDGSKRKGVTGWTEDREWTGGIGTFRLVDIIYTHITQMFGEIQKIFLICLWKQSLMQTKVAFIWSKIL